jgi:hypothetical protein
MQWFLSKVGLSNILLLTVFGTTNTLINTGVAMAKTNREIKLWYVQAALAPVAMDSVRAQNRPEEERVHAERVLVVCVLSILLTAPVAAIIITLSGPRLLTNTTAPAVVEGWRRSARPSLRDITITDEDDGGRKGVAT